MRPLFYDRKGNPVDVMAWANTYEDRQVARTEIAEGWWVSTIHLGINIHGNDPPLIFETIVFVGGYPQDAIWRWHTEKAALAGHDQIVAEQRAQIEEPTK